MIVGFFNNAAPEGYKERISAIQEVLYAKDGGGVYYYLMEAYDNHIVYRMEVNNGTSKMYSQNCSFDADGKVFLDPASIQEVKMTKTYTPVTANADTGKEEGGVKTMADKKEEGCCPKLVADIVANSAGRFTEEDKTWMVNLSEEQLGKLILAKTPEVTNNAEPTPVPKKPTTLAELFSDLQPGEKDMIGSWKTAYDRQKGQVISTIKANERNPFSDDQLNAKSLEELTALAALAGPAKTEAQPMGFDFTGNLGAAAGLAVIVEDEPLTINTIETPIKK